MKYIVLDSKREATYYFSNTLAANYWNALTAANGGEVKGALYGVSTYTLKESIDNYFIAGSTWLSNMTGMYLYIGGTEATHAINAVNPGTYNLTFEGSPTQSANGFGALDGTTQYARTGIVDSVVFSINNIHLSALSATNSTGSQKAYVGANVGASSQRSNLQYLAASSVNTFDTYTGGGARVVGTANQTNGFWLGSRIATNDSKLYLNAVQDGTIGATAGTQPNIEFYLGAWNNNGAPGLFSDFLYKFHSIGTGLTAAKVASLNSALTVLQNVLGR